MSVFSDSGILEVIAVTLAVVMMLGPLVPYAIIRAPASQTTRQIIGSAADFTPARFPVIFIRPSGFAFSFDRVSSFARSPSITGFAMGATPGISRTLLKRSSIEGRSEFTSIAKAALRVDREFAGKVPKLVKLD